MAQDISDIMLSLCPCKLLSDKEEEKDMSEMDGTKDDMHEELFINTDEKGDFWIAPESKENYLNILSSGADALSKAKALSAVIECYRFEAFNDAGRLKKPTIVKIIETMRSVEQALGSESLGKILFYQGGRSESFRDYESAATFYEESLACEILDPEVRYWRLNNLAFCLNFLRCFEKAETYLKEAIFMKPLRYNAWKNLGVSFEHQGDFDRACDCYVQAMTCSNSEARSSAHFRRILERYPVLKKKYVKIKNGKE